MGKRGPKPTPTDVLKLRGSWRGEVRDDEPVATGEPYPPAWLTKNARKVWDEVMPHLVGLGVAKAVDSNTLAMFCDAMSQYITLAKRVEREGVVRAGKANPCVRMRDDAFRRAVQVAREFGFTPSARVGLSANQQVHTALSSFKLA